MASVSKNSNIKKSVDTLSSIDGALTAIHEFKDDNIDYHQSYKSSANPLDLLLEILKRTKGYDFVIQYLSEFIAFQLPIVEASVKAILLTHVSNMFTCAGNPAITKEILEKGFTIDLKKIDMYNLLSYSPLDHSGEFQLTLDTAYPSKEFNVGKYYYFGCDDITYVHDLRMAGDFNAFLWYVKNKSLQREVWMGVNMLDATVSDSTVNFANFKNKAFANSYSSNAVDGDLKYTITQRPRRYVDKEIIDLDDLPTITDIFKYQTGKFDGIMTLKYTERASTIDDCEGNAQPMASPMTNCLQVFIGNVDTNYSDADREAIKQKSEEYKTKIVSLKTKRRDLLREFNKKDDEIIKAKKELKNLQKTITEESGNGQNPEENAVKVANQKITELENGKKEIKQKLDENEKAILEQQEFLMDVGGLYTSAKNEYRHYWQNYYYLHPMLEWNIDYIMSLKLFDSRVITSRLIDAITGCATIDFEASVSCVKDLIKDEVESIIKSVIETDDAVVSDCFFAFSNEDYERMLHKAELRKAGLFTINGEENPNVKLTAESVLSSLDNINSSSTKEQIQTIIEGGIKEICNTLTTPEERGNPDFDINYEVKFSFIENLLTNLTYVITSVVVSPKIYLLIAINMQIVGQQPNNGIREFIDANKKMIVDIIREIKDIVLEWLKGKVMDVVSDITQLLSLKLAEEQLDYYRKLIQKMFKCMRMFNWRDKLKDFNIADVNYADIYGSDNTEEAESIEC